MTLAHLNAMVRKQKQSNFKFYKNLPGEVENIKIILQFATCMSFLDHDSILQFLTRIVICAL